MKHALFIVALALVACATQPNTERTGQAAAQLTSSLAETGSYTGNGTSQTITLGTDAAVVVVASTRSGGPPTGRALSYHLAGMPAGSMLESNSAAVYTSSGGITLGAASFDVGSDDSINRNGTTFHWVAYGDGPNTLTGSYTGNGSDPQTISVNGEPRCPGLMFVMQTTGVERSMVAVKRASDVLAVVFSGDSDWGRSATILPTGCGDFDVQVDANTDGETYHYAIVYSDDGADTFGHWESYQATNATRSFDQGEPIAALWLLSVGLKESGIWLKTDTMGSGEHGRLDAAYSFESSGIDLNATGFTLQGSTANLCRKGKCNFYQKYESY